MRQQNPPCVRARLRWFFGLVGLVSACTGRIESGAGSDPGSPAGGSTGTAGSSSTAGTGSTGGAPPVVTAASCKAAGVTDAGVGRWRRLTAPQYENTVRDLLGLAVDRSAFLQDSKTGSFATNAELPPQSTDIDNYQTAAEKLGAQAVANLSALLGSCDPKAQGEDVCADAFITDFGARAYRHALTPEQKKALTAVYQVGKAESFSKGIELTVEAALQAPEFLYLIELGGDSTSALHVLDDYELASRLSYLFWNSMPDAELFTKAKAGSLKSATELTAQAQRLMQSERFLGSATSFHDQLFRVERLSQAGIVSKDPTQSASFDASLKSAMTTEAADFVRYLFAEGGATVRSLLTAKVAFPKGPLAAVYGLSAAPASGRLDLTDGTRSGFLSLPAVMAAVPPLPTRHQAVMRGNLVRRELLCDLVPPPNVAVNFMLPPNADKLSNQELLRVHKDNPSCSGCHELMDPIGFGFESFDGLGRYITKTPSGDNIDSTGYVQGLDDAKVDFANASELSEKLAASPEVRSCLATQWFRFALARDPHAGDECSLSAVDKVLSAGDGDIRQALLTLVSSDAFRIRKGQ